MSGIFGVYHREGRPVDREELTRMRGALAHRGPDGSGIWERGNVALGHTAHRTTPESIRETQPLESRDRSLVITADARIDNRDELIGALGLRDRPGDVSDSQLVLAAYERWGGRCPERLVGDFAFALWDSRQQILFCARDHAGVKPFYYYQSGTTFLFASEIKALLCSPEVPRELDEVRVADYLLAQLEDPVITFYKRLHRLPPANTLTVGPTGVRSRAYWSLDPTRELRLASNEAYAEAFGEVFTAAVRCRLGSHRPVGALLSGGLDSSSIVCTARRLLTRQSGPRLKTFSAVFPGLPEEQLSRVDERRYVEAVTAPGGLEAHFVRADELSPIGDIDAMLEEHDEPIASPQLFMSLGLCRAAAEAGVQVLLDGFGGDSTVSHGTGYLDELLRSGRWEVFASEVEALSRRLHHSPAEYLRHYGSGFLRELAAQGRWMAFVEATGQLSRRFGVSRSRLLLSHGAKPLLSSSILRRLRRKARDESKPLIRRDFADRVGLPERRRALAPPRAAPRTAREDHYLGLVSGAIPVALTEADRIGAAMSIELRFPYFDRRLMEFCLSLPGDQKLHDGWGRIVMRRAMEGILPSQVQWRPDKADLAPNFTHGLLGKDRGFLDETILHDPSAVAPFVDVEVLRGMYRGYLSGNGSNEIAHILWRVVVLDRWLRGMSRASKRAPTYGRAGAQVALS